MSARDIKLSFADKKKLLAVAGELTLAEKRIKRLEDALKDKITDLSTCQRQLEEMTRQRDKLAYQLEHSDRLLSETKNVAKREAQKFLLAACVIDRFSGGVKRLREMVNRALAAAWADSVDGGPSHELESISGAIDSLKVMPTHIKAGDRDDSREQIIERSE